MQVNVHELKVVRELFIRRAIAQSCLEPFG